MSLKPGALRSAPSTISLMNGPGDSTFTRTFHDAHSCAMLIVRLTSAAFEAAYAHTPGPPEYAAIDAMLTMLPPPCSRMIGATHWPIRSGPSTLTLKILRHTDRSMVLTVRRDGVMPALLTTTSM